MRKIHFIAFLFLTFNVFSQHKDVIEPIDMPSSIFSSYTFDNLQFNNQDKVNALHLTGYKFMVVDYISNNFLYNNNLQFDLRNIGRSISFDDLSDNFRKSELKIYDVGKNNEHFIWKMWDVSQQKEYQQNNN